MTVKTGMHEELTYPALQVNDSLHSSGVNLQHFCRRMLLQLVVSELSVGLNVHRLNAVSRQHACIPSLACSCTLEVHPSIFKSCTVCCSCLQLDMLGQVFLVSTPYKPVAISSQSFIEDFASKL